MKQQNDRLHAQSKDLVHSDRRSKPLSDVGCIRHPEDTPGLLYPECVLGYLSLDKHDQYPHVGTHKDFPNRGIVQGSRLEDMTLTELAEAPYVELGKTHKPDADVRNPALIDFHARFASRKLREFLFLLDGSGQIIRDANGCPINPWFSTGINGRGDLRLHGPQIANDAIVLVKKRDGQGYLFVGLGRNDDLQSRIALPGGWENRKQGESPQAGAARELWEETNIRLSPDAFRVVKLRNSGDPEVDYLYPCYPEPRNTNNAWIYTRICVTVVSEDEAMRWTLLDDTEGGTTGARLYELNEANLRRMYYQHPDEVRLAANACGIPIAS